MAVNDIFQISSIFTWQDQELINVLHYQQTQDDATLTEAELVDFFCERLQEHVDAELIPTLSDSISHQGCEGFILNKPTVAGEFLFQTDGTDTGKDIVAVRSAPVMTKLTDLRGRSYRGRMFCPPVTEDRQNGGLLTAAAITELVDYGTALRDLSNAGNTIVAKLEVYSPKLSTLPGGPYVTTRVKNWRVNQIMGSMRSRQKVNPT